MVSAGTADLRDEPRGPKRPIPFVITRPVWSGSVDLVLDIVGLFHYYMVSLRGK